jgi:D-sedoheptulose 7-phosphate isomerase
MDSEIQAYFANLGALGGRLEAGGRDGASVTLFGAAEWTIQRLGEIRAREAKVMFVGNGGSAAIASHMAIDYSKNGGFSALAFNDGAALTCLANDLGYDRVFAEQVAQHGRSGDLLVAISSSGSSANIVNAAVAARARDIAVLTLSGFEPDNRLRALGDINIYVPSGLYGFVEIAHLTFCHAILDIVMGWRAEGDRPIYAEARRNRA